VSSDSSGKNLIVSAPKEYHNQIKKLILSLDNPSELPEVRVIPVVYGYSSDLALIMQNVIRVSKPNKVSSGQFGISSRFDIDTTGIVLSDDRTNQLIVISDKLTNTNIEKLVRAIDVKYLNGAEVDYIINPMGGGFKVNNPNAVKACGCGSSFSVEDDVAGRTLTGGCGSCSK